MSTEHWTDFNRVHEHVTAQLAGADSATISSTDWNTIMECIADLVRLGDSLEEITAKLDSERSMADAVLEFAEGELLRIQPAEGSA